MLQASGAHLLFTDADLSTPIEEIELMKKGLLADKTNTLEQFCLNSGVKNKDAMAIRHSTQQLKDGLTFLQQVNLFPITGVPFPLTVVHGEDDAIVPARAGQILCERSQGAFVQFAGNHMFFDENMDAMHSLIRETESS